MASTKSSNTQSDSLTPASTPAKTFEFKEIDYPAIKCPNRQSNLGDHWILVNTVAAHLNGKCYLNKDHVDSEKSPANSLEPTRQRSKATVGSFTVPFSPVFADCRKVSGRV